MEIPAGLRIRGRHAAGFAAASGKKAGARHAIEKMAMVGGTRDSPSGSARALEQGDAMTTRGQATREISARRARRRRSRRESRECARRTRPAHL